MNKRAQERARVLKQQKVATMVRRANAKRRRRAAWAVARKLFAFSAAATLIGGALIMLYIIAGAYRAVINQASTGVFVGRAKAANIIAPQGITFAPDFATAAPMETEVEESTIDNIVEAAARAYDLNAALLRAIIKVESSGNSQAVNGTTRGIMQLTRTTRRQLGIGDHEAHDPAVGIDGGAVTLRHKIDEQKGNVSEAVQSYFCGTSRKECIGKPQGLQYLGKVTSALGDPAIFALGHHPTKHQG